MIDTGATRARTEALFPFVRELAPELHRELFRSASFARIPAGHPVCLEGAFCPHLALILSGSARVYKLGESGRDITLYRVDPGQSCILTASCILSESAFPAFAECEEPTEAVLLPSARVRDWTARSETFRHYLFGLMSQRLGDLIGVVEEVVFRRLDRRLAGYLRQRASPADQRIETTHQEIASDLGSSREVVSRLLKEFEGHGLIRIGRGVIQVLDAEGLEAKGAER